MTPEKETLVIHRLQSACGHLDAVVTMVETGEPCECILHQLGAVQASLREIGLVILEKELIRTTKTILSVECYEERMAATRQLLGLYDLLYKKPIKNFME